MAIAIPDFWKLIIESQLMTPEQCQHLGASYGNVPGAAADPSPNKLAKWLISQNVLSRYQAKVLLGGRPGPFQYGDYRIYDRIGDGRLSGAFRAIHIRTNHPVMLRFLTGSVVQDPTRLSQLGAVLPAIVHSNVVRCFELVDLATYKFLVLEDLQGKSLAEKLGPDAKLPPATACTIARMVALGLEQIHQAGRPHGDVRPENIWLERTGNIKLLIEADTTPGSLDLSGADATVIDRADYLAPELGQPGTSPDVLTDIYALGCTLYQLIAGAPPFAAGSPREKMKRHATESIQPLESLGAPQPVGQLVSYMMAKNPAMRYQRASMVAEQLGPFVDPKRSSIPPAPATPTQGAFEAEIQQRRCVAVPTAPVMGPNAPAAAAPAPQIKVDVPAKKKRPIGKSASPAGSVSAAIRERKRSNQKKSLMIGLATVVITVVVCGAGYFALTRLGGGAETADGTVDFDPKRLDSTASETPVGQDVDTGSEVAAVEPTSTVPEIVEDDGNTLWASPTAGGPIKLEFVAGGAQVFLIARPAQLVGSDEGGRVLRALGPEFEAATTQWESAAGVRLGEIDQLMVALYGNNGGYPRASFVVRLLSPASRDDLLEKWGNPEATEAGSGEYYRKGEWAYYIPSGENAFVMGAANDIKEVAESDGAPPLLRREIGQLLRVSDDQRHFTALFTPAFLLGDGRPLFEGKREKSLAALDWFLGDDLKAAMLSMHFGDQFFYEMRLQSDIVMDQFTLASRLRDRMEMIPDIMESYIVRINPHPYWGLIAFRYPLMIRFLHRYTRIGVDGTHATINGVLPGTAAHNLIFGGELVLASAPGGYSAPVPATAPSGPKTLDEVLKSKMSINFDQDSLEFAMQNVVKEVVATSKPPFEFAIRIQGEDLKLDGITRNQQIRDFAQDNTTVSEVLTALVMKANPITTVKDPSERDQKLVWVIAPDPNNPTNQIILVTTRQVAEQKYNLPEVFGSP